MECAETAYSRIKGWLYRASKRLQFTFVPALAQVASRAVDAKQEQLDNDEMVIAELEVESHCSHEELNNIDGKLPFLAQQHEIKSLDKHKGEEERRLHLKEALEDDFKAERHSAEAPLREDFDQGEDPGGVQDVKAVLLRAARAEARAELLEKSLEELAAESRRREDLIQYLTGSMASGLAEKERADRLEELCQKRNHQIDELQEAAAQANWQMELLQGHADELARILLPAEENAENA